MQKKKTASERKYISFCNNFLYIKSGFNRNSEITFKN